MKALRTSTRMKGLSAHDRYEAQTSHGEVAQDALFACCVVEIRVYSWVHLETWIWQIAAQAQDHRSMMKVAFSVAGKHVNDYFLSWHNHMSARHYKLANIEQIATNAQNHTCFSDSLLWIVTPLIRCMRACLYAGRVHQARSARLRFMQVFASCETHKAVTEKRAKHALTPLES